MIKKLINSYFWDRLLAAANADHQVIVAQWLAAESSDQMQLEPMIKAIEASAKRLPKELSADSGCCSERNLEILEDSGICGYVATGGQKHGKAAGTGAKARREGTLREKMVRRREMGRQDGPYRRRKITIEPIFGQTKQARRFRQFLLRGLRKVWLEWAPVCLAHNFMMLFASHVKPKDQCDAGKGSRRRPLVQKPTSVLVPFFWDRLLGRQPIELRE